MVNDSASSLFHAIVQLFMGTAATCPPYSIIQLENSIFRLLGPQMRAIWNTLLKRRSSGIRLVEKKGRWYYIWQIRKIKFAAEWLRKLAFSSLYWFPFSPAIICLLIPCRGRGPQHPLCVRVHSAFVFTAESNQTFTEKGKTFVIMANWHHISFMQNTTPTQSIITRLCRSSALKMWRAWIFILLWNSE